MSREKAQIHKKYSDQSDDEDPIEEWIIHAEHEHMKDNEIIHTLIKRGYSNERIREYFPNYKPVEQEKYFRKHLAFFSLFLILTLIFTFIISSSSLGVIGVVLVILFLSGYEYLKYYKYINFTKSIVFTFNALIASNIAFVIIISLVYLFLFLIFDAFKLYQIIIISGIGFMIFGVIYSIIMKIFTNKYTYDEMEYGFLHIFKHLVVLIIVTLGMLFAVGIIINEEIDNIKVVDVSDDIDQYLLSFTCSNYFNSCQKVSSVTNVSWKYQYCTTWDDCEKRPYNSGLSINNYYNYLYLVNDGEEAIFAVKKDKWKEFVRDGIAKSKLDIPVELKDDLNIKFNELIDEKDFLERTDPIRTIINFEGILRDITDYQFGKVNRVLMLSEFQKIAAIDANRESQNGVPVLGYDELIVNLEKLKVNEKFEVDLPIEIDQIKFIDKLEIAQIFESIVSDFPTIYSAKIELIKYLQETEEENESEKSKYTRLILANKIAER